MKKPARLPFPFSEDVIERNADVLFGHVDKPSDVKVMPLVPEPAFKSQLEADYADELTRRGLIWLYEPITLHLPGGVGYTPDFLVVDLDRRTFTFVEVKGSKRMKNARDSRTRARVAAGFIPWVHWRWVERQSRNSPWSEEKL